MGTAISVGDGTAAEPLSKAADSKGTWASTAAVASSSSSASEVGDAICVGTGTSAGDDGAEISGAGGGGTDSVDKVAVEGWLLLTCKLKGGTESVMASSSSGRIVGEGICVGTAISSSGDCGGAEDGKAPDSIGERCTVSTGSTSSTSLGEGRKVGTGTSTGELTVPRDTKELAVREGTVMVRSILLV